jgi:hypothetical protein
MMKVVAAGIVNDALRKARSKAVSTYDSECEREKLELERNAPQTRNGTKNQKGRLVSSDSNSHGEDPEK